MCAKKKKEYTEKEQDGFDSLLLVPATVFFNFRLSTQHKWHWMRVIYPPMFVYLCTKEQQWKWNSRKCNNRVQLYITNDHIVPSPSKDNSQEVPLMLQFTTYASIIIVVSLSSHYCTLPFCRLSLLWLCGPQNTNLTIIYCTSNPPLAGISHSLVARWRNGNDSSGEDRIVWTIENGGLRHNDKKESMTSPHEWASTQTAAIHFSMF